MPETTPSPLSSLLSFFKKHWIITVPVTLVLLYVAFNHGTEVLDWFKAVSPWFATIVGLGLGLAIGYAANNNLFAKAKELLFAISRFLLGGTLAALVLSFAVSRFYGTAMVDYFFAKEVLFIAGIFGALVAFKVIPLPGSDEFKKLFGLLWTGLGIFASVWILIFVFEDKVRPYAAKVGPGFFLWVVAGAAVLCWFIAGREAVREQKWAPLLRWGVPVLAGCVILISTADTVAFNNGRTVDLSDEYRLDVEFQVMRHAVGWLESKGFDTTSPIETLETNPDWVRENLESYRTSVDQAGLPAALRLYEASPEDIPKGVRFTPARLLDVVRFPSREANDTHRGALKHVLRSDIERTDLSSTAKYRRGENARQGTWSLKDGDEIVPVDSALRAHLEEIDSRLLAGQTVSLIGGEPLRWETAFTATVDTTVTVQPIATTLEVEAFVTSDPGDGTEWRPVDPMGWRKKSGRFFERTDFTYRRWLYPAGRPYALVGAIVPSGKTPGDWRQIFPLEFGVPYTIPAGKTLIYNINVPMDDRVSSTQKEGEELKQNHMRGAWQLQVTPRLAGPVGKLTATARELGLGQFLGQ